jgi:hypothetical protein
LGPNPDYGRVETLAPLARAECLSDAAIEDGWQHHVWHPSSTLVNELPEQFIFAMRSCRDKTGRRTFFPTADATFLTDAYSGGMAYRMRHWGLTPYERYERRRRWVLYRKTFQMPERLENRFVSIRSLISGDVFRLTLESDPQLEGVGVGSLFREAREEVREWGLDTPSESQLIAFALYRAARRNPLFLRNPEEVTVVVRNALFDLPGPSPTRIVQPVTEKSHKMIDDWLDLTDEQFDARFFRPGNNVLANLKNQTRRCSAEDLTDDGIRRVVLDEGWRAGLWVGQCVGDMLTRFAAALPEPLTDAERRLFEEMYLPRNYLAGLPLSLLCERKVVLAAALPDVWKDSTDRDAVGILHRVLALYTELAINRRLADRSFTTASLPHHVVLGDGIVTRSSSGGTGSDSDSSDAATAVLNEIGEQFRLDRGIVCTCDIPRWVQTYSWNKDERRIFFDYRCEICEERVEQPVSWDEIRHRFPDGL